MYKFCPNCKYFVSVFSRERAGFVVGCSNPSTALKKANTEYSCYEEKDKIDSEGEK